MKLSDPGERAKKLIQVARAIQVVTTIHDFFIRLSALASNTDTFLLYEHGTNRLVGSISYTYPKHVEDQLRKDLGKCGITWRIYVWWQTFGIYMRLLWLAICGHSTLAGDKFRTLMANIDRAFTLDIPSEQELSLMSYDELKNTYYPKASMFEITSACIHPDFQKRGLGKFLIKETMKTIPVIDTPFTYKGKTSFGPQKFKLVSTHVGVNLYLQLGFSAERSFDEPHDEIDKGFVIRNKLMLLTREYWCYAEK
jgi:hypothetical protein